MSNQSPTYHLAVALIVSTALLCATYLVGQALEARPCGHAETVSRDWT